MQQNPIWIVSMNQLKASSRHPFREAAGLTCMGNHKRLDASAFHGGPLSKSWLHGTPLNMCGAARALLTMELEALSPKATQLRSGLVPSC